MIKNHIFTRLLSLLLSLCLILTFAGCSVGKGDDIVILFTGDIACATEENLGFSGVSAYKKAMLEKTPYVSLVDLGNAVQGKFIGTVSKGDYVVDFMNKAGYDLAVPGNHEFDYGLEQFYQLTERANAEYLISNVTYVGLEGNNAFEKTKPYKIVKYGNRKVGFVGVTTPKVLTQTLNSTFMEGESYVYDFEQGGSRLYNTVQGYVNECKNKGADYVVILSHLGDTDESLPYTASSLIKATFDVDAVLDAHAGSEISNRLVKNKNGLDVTLASAGKELENIGQLTISQNGNISSGMISGYSGKDTAVDNYATELKATLEEQMNEVVAVCDTPLKRTDLKGRRTINNRENILGNFCADAYRLIADADIALINGDRIRGDLPAGDVTYADILNLSPFNDSLCKIYATGEGILNALEIANMYIESEYEEDGEPIGESPVFMQVSGIRFTVDTSIEPSVVFDKYGKFKEVSGKRRIKDVQVLNEQGTYTFISPDKAYSVVSNSYFLKDNEDGLDLFENNPVLIDNGILTYEVVLKYLTEHLEGRTSQRYSGLDGRITVE